MHPIERISPQEAYEKQKEGYTYIDVRSEPEFAEGHPQRAINIPLLHHSPDGMRPNPDFLHTLQTRFPKNAKLVLGCHSGGRSLHAAQMLIEDGYQNILEQRAGWDGTRNPFGQLIEPGWSRTPLPTETNHPSEHNNTEL